MSSVIVTVDASPNAANDPVVPGGTEAHAGVAERGRRGEDEVQHVEARAAERRVDREHCCAGDEHGDVDEDEGDDRELRVLARR